MDYKKKGLHNINLLGRSERSLDSQRMEWSDFSWNVLNGKLQCEQMPASCFFLLLPGTLSSEVLFLFCCEEASALHEDSPPGSVIIRDRGFSSALPTSDPKRNLHLASSNSLQSLSGSSALDFIGVFFFTALEILLELAFDGVLFILAFPSAFEEVLLILAFPSAFDGVLLFLGFMSLFWLFLNEEESLDGFRFGFDSLFDTCDLKEQW